MNLTDEKEQNQNVEAKYLDPCSGFEIELKKDKLYKIRKMTKIVKPVKYGGQSKESTFNKLDHYREYSGNVIEDFEEGSFLTDSLLDEIIEETQADEYSY